jgi:hypothetical protein
MGTTHSGSPSLWAMIEDSTEEFYTASSGEGGSNFSFSSRHDTGAPPAPVVTIPWLDNIPATQVMTMVPPWMPAPRSDTGHPPLPRAMACFSGRANSVSPRSVSQCRERGSTMTKQALRQASNHHGPVARGRTRCGEDSNGGLRFHPSSG